MLKLISNRNFLSCLLLTVFSVANSYSQNQTQYSIGAGLNRYGFSLDAGIHKSKEESKVVWGDWRFGLGNIQHPREVALINNALQSSGVYKFGKINYCWALRSYYQASYSLYRRTDRKSVALNMIGGVGLPLAYSWPVYVRYYQRGTGGASDAYAEVRYDPEIHLQSEIGGRARFSRGFREGKLTPGLGLNTALEFGWGNYSSDLRMLTIGTRIESFAKTLPIMYKDELNKRTYSMFYFNFAFSIGNN